MPRSAGRVPSGGALLSLAAAVGAAVGLRSVAALELPRFRLLLRVAPVPRETLGLTWSPRAVWPDQLQEAALERLAGVVVALFLAAMAVALLNALVLLADAGAARRREMAVRTAVGAGRRTLLALLLRHVRALLLAGVVVGLLAGLAAGGALRASWPGAVETLGWVEALGTGLPLLGLLAAAAAAAYVHVGLGVTGGAPLAPDLGSGGRLTAHPAEVFRRRVLSAFQMGMGGAVALGALALASSVATAGGPAPGDGDALALSVRARGEGPPPWARLLPALEGLDGVDLAAVASPGALVGLGVRDNALAQCGNCYRGGLPLPLWGARADHHAVAPGFFDSLGMVATSGRLFTEDDIGGARPVAVVNRTFANTAFEKGNPLGRMVRLGRDLDGWYEVIGVVEDRTPVVLGGDELARAAVYVSALEHPPAGGELIVRGTEEGAARARALLLAAGVDAGAPRSLRAVADEARAPVRWMAGLALGLGLLALALALHGVHATTLQVTRRRTQEMAIRRVLGAPAWRVMGHVLVGGARTAFGGVAVAVFFGSLLVAVLRRAAAGVPAPGVDGYVAVCVLLVGAASLASVRAGREALSVEPARALE